MYHQTQAAELTIENQRQFGQTWSLGRQPMPQLAQYVFTLSAVRCSAPSGRAREMQIQRQLGVSQHHQCNQKALLCSRRGTQV